MPFRSKIKRKHSADRKFREKAEYSSARKNTAGIQT